MPPASRGAGADAAADAAADAGAGVATGVATDAAAGAAAVDGGAGQHTCHHAAARNVRLAYAFNALSSLATSIVLGSFFSTYLYSLSSSNDVVGYISATAGLAMIVVAAPVGYYTDRWPRHWMLRLSGVLGAAASAAMFVALQADSLGALYGAAAAYGVYSACNGAPLNSILADSTGADRTRVFILQYALSLLAGAGGPLIATLFFWRLGNAWETPVLRAVMHAGNGLNAASTALLWLFVSDEPPAPDVAEADGAGERGRGGSDACATASDGAAAPSLCADDGGVACSVPAAAATAADAPLEHTATRNLGHQTLRLPLLCCLDRGGGTLTVRAIPYIIFTSDILIAIGAGMTVQFFALYFANDLHLSPLLVSAVYVASPVSVALFSLAAMPLARLVGRAWASVLLDALGTACLFGLSLRSPAYVAVPLYLVRTAAMNASYPTQRAIMMDVVPKRDRGKWSALENVTSFTWTGSAALGGWLIDAYGYGFSFKITALIYVAGTATLGLLVPLTWGEVVPGTTAGSGAGGGDKGGAGNEDAAAVATGAGGAAAVAVGAGGDDDAKARLPEHVAATTRRGKTASGDNDDDPGAPLLLAA